VVEVDLEDDLGLEDDSTVYDFDEDNFSLSDIDQGSIKESNTSEESERKS
jgi:hypothetical protein